MFRRLCRRSAGALHARAAVLVFTTLAVFVVGGSRGARAGGFGIFATLPSPEVLERDKNAVLVLTAMGCHGPGATISATAEGLVNGQRRSVKLTLTPLPSPVATEGNAPAFPRFAVKRQWPAEGTWVLALHARGACGPLTTKQCARSPACCSRLVLTAAWKTCPPSPSARRRASRSSRGSTRFASSMCLVPQPKTRKL